MDTCSVIVDEVVRDVPGGGIIDSKSDSSESDVGAIVPLTWMV